MRREAWNAWALPWKVPISDAGICISRSACWMACVAVPSDPPCARLKLMVTAGNCPWWLIDSGSVLRVVHVANVASGTCWPVVGEWT